MKKTSKQNSSFAVKKSSDLTSRNLFNRPFFQKNGFYGLLRAAPRRHASSRLQELGRPPPPPPSDSSSDSSSSIFFSIFFYLLPSSLISSRAK
jgi:hypothetical protein